MSTTWGRHLRRLACERNKEATVIHKRIYKFSVLLFCLAVLILFPKSSGASVFYVDDEGMIVSSPPPGVEPLEATGLEWWLNKAEKKVNTEGPTGGIVSMASSQKPTQKSISMATTGAGCTISIINLDDPGLGFNDNTPVSPVGGNTGTTLGQQRMNAFRRATEIWAERLNSSVPIVVEAGFAALPCEEGGAWGAGTLVTSFHKDFSGAPRPNTWYVQSHANALAETDLSPVHSDMQIWVNSSLDEGCIPGINWYYGLDGNCPATSLDFVTISLHEICHGLGFMKLVSESGERYQGYDDVFMLFLRDVSAGKNWSEMTDSERAASSIDTDDLVWIGDTVNAASWMLSTGLHSISEQVMMFAPNTYVPPSSVSHFSNECYPNQLMEPSCFEVIHELDLCVELLIDIGWDIEPRTSVPVELWQSYE